MLNRASARALGQVRLVGEGQNEIVSIGVALDRAEDEGLDLVLVSDQVTPPVVRIQDFKKLQYEAKKAKQKHARSSELKEIQLKVNISEHDLGIKVGRVKNFLERGDKVKLSVRLKGRERENPQRAVELIERVSGMVDCKISRVPGPMTIAILEPVKAAAKP